MQFEFDSSACHAGVHAAWSGKWLAPVLLAAGVAFGPGCSADAFTTDSSPDDVTRVNDVGSRGGAGDGHRGSTYSSPIALSRDGRLLWTVNAYSGRLSVIDTITRALVVSAPVGADPQSIAVDREGRYAYVANAKSNDVSIIDVARLLADGAGEGSWERRVVTGAAPSSVVISPDGRHVFVANASQDTITVLDGREQELVGVIDLGNGVCNEGGPSQRFQPRAMAITPDSEHLYVTRFLSTTRRGGTQLADYGKEGLVCRVDLNGVAMGMEPESTPIRLAPSDAGFPDRNGAATGAFPNQLQSIVIRGGHAYVPNIAASPTGPLRFDVDTQAYVNRIDGIGAADTDGGALNLHLGARDPEPGKRELYFANPWAIAFTTPAGRGAAYVVSAASDVLVKLDVDASGALQFTTDGDTTRYIDLNDPDDPATSAANAGKNPIGIVIDSAGTFAYVLNDVSRNVSIVNLSDDVVEAVVPTGDLPEPGSTEERLLVGAEMFFSSRGNFVRPPAALGSSRNRLSEKGHQACSSCHAAGLTDGVVWQFASGPRKTIAINGTTNPWDRSQQRIINASAIFDEFADVDFNTRRVSSGEPLAAPRPCVDSTPPSGLEQSTNDPDHGLILGEADDFALAPCVLVPFATPNQGRAQPRVQLPGSPVEVEAADALEEWQRSAVVTPNRPMTTEELAAAGLTGPGLDDHRLSLGRALFDATGCVDCHGGAQWTTQTKDFVSPPDPAEVATEGAIAGANASPYLYRFLTDVGTFDINVSGSENELPDYPAIGGAEKDANGLNALGFDYDGDGKGSGYNTPSLLGGHALPPYFHNGACESFACVLASVPHRRAGLDDGQPDPLDDEAARADLALYLTSIDLSSPPHGEAAPPSDATTTAP